MKKRKLREAVTPDAILSFAVWLTRARKSFWLRLWYRARDLVKLNIWEIGESGGFYHHYDSETETWRYTSNEYPASRDSRITYYRESRLPLDRPSTFSNKKTSYPLEGTRDIVVCPRCHGRGRENCSSCGGNGNCGSCGGRGSQRGPNGRERCGSCGGDGDCGRCGGSGDQTCGRCDGEGRLVVFESKDYRWKHHRDKETILLPNTDRGNVRGLIRDTLKEGGSVALEAYEREEIVAKTGVLNQRIEEGINLAQQKKAELETKIHSRGHLLFMEVEKHYVPMGFVNVNLGKKYGQFFVAGSTKGKHYEKPPVPVCFWRVAAWAGVVGLGVIAATEARSFSLTLVGKIGLGVTASLITAGLISFFLDLKSKTPQRWVILDDEDGSGWNFVYSLIYSLAKTRKAKVVDGFFTYLLEASGRAEERGRNSFMCTLQALGQEKPQTLELIYINQRAQKLFPAEAAILLKDAARISWAGIPGNWQQNPLIQARQNPEKGQPKPLSLWLVSDTEAGPSYNSEFQIIEPVVRQDRFPLATIYRETQAAGSTEVTSGVFEELADLPIWLD